MVAVALLSGWGLVVAILTAFVLIAGATREGAALYRWMRRRFFPEPPPPPIPPPVYISEQIPQV